MNCGTWCGQFGFISSHKNVILFTVLILFLITSSTSASAQHLNDYPEVSLPAQEMIHEPAGAFIKLKCVLNPCNIKNIIFKWEFKVCGSDLTDKRKCRNNKNDTWINIQENNKNEHCSSTYLIKKAMGKDSGLYRCSYLHGSEEIKIMKIYQLHIVEPYHARNGTKPELLDIKPINITVAENLKIVIQCKVFSDFILPPEIWWLKHMESSTVDDKSSIIHNNKTYLKLNSSQMALANYTYISKLIIEKSNENDTGLYTCVAVNFYGNSNKDVYVDVIAQEKDWQGTTSFSILFLIPLGFALIPISGGLCVYYYRKKKLRKLQARNEVKAEIYKYQPMLNKYNLDRHNRIINSTNHRIV